MVGIKAIFSVSCYCTFLFIKQTTYTSSGFKLQSGALVCLRQVVSNKMRHGLINAKVGYVYFVCTSYVATAI